MEKLDSSDLTLKVGRTRGGENTSTVTVAWCLSQRLSDQLVDEHARDPHVLLFVTHDTNGHAVAQQFQVVPLHTGMTYVGLRHAGINTIHAMIVWRMEGRGKPSQMIRHLGDVSSAEWPVEALHDRRNLLYKHFDKVMTGGAAERKLQDMIDRVNKQIEDVYDGPQDAMLREFIPRVDQFYFSTAIDVDVPKGMFAREPWAGERWLANFASKKKKIDECHSRKYALYGLAKLVGVIVASPLILAYWLLLKSVCALFVMWHLLLGSRSIGYRALFSWRFASPMEVTRHTGRSIWWFRRLTADEKKSLHTNAEFTARNAIFVIVNPPVLLGITLIAWLIIALNSFWVNLLICIAVVLAILVVAALWLFSTKGVEDAIARHEARERARLAAELAAVTCATPQQSAIVGYEIKPRRQTVRLAFLETKSWVCKPFSQ